MKLLSIFTGAGGLDVGLEKSGFAVAACVERDEDCRKTLGRNRDWTLVTPGDIHESDSRRLLRLAAVKRGDIALLSAGPPCQPFSKAAMWTNGSIAGMKDFRSDTIRALLSLVGAVLPEVLLIENVPGVIRRSRERNVPSVVNVIGRALNSINRQRGTKYALQTFTLDAADFGVAQHRVRTFMLASRNGDSFEPPQPTHGSGSTEGGKLFACAWDAIGRMPTDRDDPELQVTGQWAGLLPSIPEGRNYLFHTPRGEGEPLFGWRTRYWSFLLKLAKDQPAWTIQATPGSATGPFHWDNRRLSIREMARLQTFPSDYAFVGSYASARRQVGNAVPCALGELLGFEIRRQLFGDSLDRHRMSLLPSQKRSCPPAGKTSAVPKRYLILRAQHRDHPGHGRGPGAKTRSQPRR